jgi:two-component system nitrate/nitrite sensor histidine kinase NarX
MVAIYLRIIRLLHTTRLLYIVPALIGCLSLILMGMCFIGYRFSCPGSQHEFVMPTAAGFWIIGAFCGTVFIITLLLRYLYFHLLLPLARLEDAVARICQGEPGASESLHQAGILTDVARNISVLNTELTDLYEDMDTRIARQTLRLAQKTASLKILYDVAAGITHTQTLDEMLLRFLRILKEMVNGRAATVRLLTADGQQRLVGAIGLDNDLIASQKPSPVDLCLCGTVLYPGEVRCDHNARYCSRLYGRHMLARDDVEVVTIPLQHHQELLGTYTIFTDKHGVNEREDIMQLLSTIGQHIGVAVAKYHADEEMHRLSIIEERTALAHELHDSLAQTLASLRLQVRLLSESLAEEQVSGAAATDLHRLRTSIDEAHHELRELLVNFRTPFHQQGLQSTLQQLAKQFEQEAGVRTVLHLRCGELSLAPMDTLQIVRITQEALHNIHKHAQAQTVRILLMQEPTGDYVLLIEDDGIGFSEHSLKNQQFDTHFGLDILKERAHRLGGTLTVDTEPGEGTRIELTFQINSC